MLLEKETFCGYEVDAFTTENGVRMYDIESIFTNEAKPFKKWIDKKEIRDLIATRGEKKKGARYYTIPDVIDRIQVTSTDKRIFANYGLMVMAAYYNDPTNLWKL